MARRVDRYIVFAVFPRRNDGDWSTFEKNNYQLMLETPAGAGIPTFGELQNTIARALADEGCRMSPHKINISGVTGPVDKATWDRWSAPPPAKDSQGRSTPTVPQYPGDCVLL